MCDGSRRNGARTSSPSCFATNAGSGRFDGRSDPQEVDRRDPLAQVNKLLRKWGTFTTPTGHTRPLARSRRCRSIKMCVERRSECTASLYEDAALRQKSQDRYPYPNLVVAGVFRKGFAGRCPAENPIDVAFRQDH